MSNKKFHLTQEGTDTSIELPVLSSTLGQDVIDISKIPETGCFTFDPGFGATASCESSITFIDGGKGVLLHGGYPIEQLAAKSDFVLCEGIELEGATASFDFDLNVDISNNLGCPLMLVAGAKDKTVFKNKEFMDTLFERLQEDNFEVRDIQLGEQGGYYEFLVNERLNGGHTTTVNWEFFSSPELRQMLGISKQLGELLQKTFIIRADAQEEKINDLQQLLEALMGRAKKGLAIQRYKGLGEMNPPQLWTTTMDPEKRTLLKVRIEDVLEADDIFTILMGDKVEPRREFIQNNALEVTELDI